ncbi:hypothetical protein C8J56DRAFT_1041714 [Mycena floridula]|nr:hypothetical protein C8J56DRAFT_1041714 [Mycena floridula]
MRERLSIPLLISDESSESNTSSVVQPNIRHPVQHERGGTVRIGTEAQIRDEIARAREAEAAIRAADNIRLQQERNDILEAHTTLINERRAFEERTRAVNLAQEREWNELVPAIPLEQDIPRNPEWVSRVALQRTRFNYLREFGESNIADQGIRFDGDGNPHERERDAAHERDAAAAYFLQNNLDPGWAFVQNTAGNNANAGRVPLQDRGHQDRPPHMQENVDIIRDDQHDRNSSGNDPSGPEDSDSGSVPPDNEKIVAKILTTIPPKMRRYIIEKRNWVPELLDRWKLMSYCLDYEERQDRAVYYDRIYEKEHHKRSAPDPKPQDTRKRNETGRFERADNRHDERREMINVGTIHLGMITTTIDRIDLDRAPVEMTMAIIADVRIIAIGLHSIRITSNEETRGMRPNLSYAILVNVRAMQEGADAGPSNGPGTAEAAAANETDGHNERRTRSHTSSEFGSERNLSYYDEIEERSSHASSRSSVGHCGIRTLEDYDDLEEDASPAVYSDFTLTENWGRPVPFSWIGPDDIAVSTLHGPMSLSMESLIGLANDDDETVVWIVEPGFDETDALGLVQLFYGYDSLLLREMLADFIFKTENRGLAYFAPSEMSSEQEWCESSWRRIHDGLYPYNPDDPWDEGLVEDSIPDWVNHVLEYGTDDPYDGDSSGTDEEFDAQPSYDDPESSDGLESSLKNSSQCLERYVGLHVEEDELKHEIERMATMSLHPTKRVKIHVSGQKIAYTLCDSGSTTDALSPDFTKVAKIKAHELENPVNVALGTVSSKSKINYGTYASVKYGPINSKEYWDILNIDRYDAIVGSVFMREHQMSLDFEHDVICIKGKAYPAMKLSDEINENVRRSRAVITETPKAAQLLKLNYSEAVAGPSTRRE